MRMKESLRHLVGCNLISARRSERCRQLLMTMNSLWALRSQLIPNLRLLSHLFSPHFKPTTLKRWYNRQKMNRYLSNFQKSLLWWRSWMRRKNSKGFKPLVSKSSQSRSSSNHRLASLASSNEAGPRLMSARKRFALKTGQSGLVRRQLFASGILRLRNTTWNSRKCRTKHPRLCTSCLVALK